MSPDYDTGLLPLLRLPVCQYAGPSDQRVELASDGHCGSVNRVPRKIRQLVADLERAGFFLVAGGKGSHRKFRHPKHAGSLVLSGHDGDDARHYQERQVRNAIRETSK